MSGFSSLVQSTYYVTPDILNSTLAVNMTVEGHISFNFASFGVEVL